MLKLPLVKALNLKELTFTNSSFCHEMVATPCFLFWARVALLLKSFGSIHAHVVVQAVDIILLLLFVCRGLQPWRVYLRGVAHYFRHRRVWNACSVALCVPVSSWERLCLAVDWKVGGRPHLGRLTWVRATLHLLPHQLLSIDVLDHLHLVLVYFLSWYILWHVLVGLALHCLHLEVGHDGGIAAILPRSGWIWHDCRTVESVAGLQAHLLGCQGASHRLVDGLRGWCGHYAGVGSGWAHLWACWGSGRYLLLLDAPTAIPLLKERSLSLILKLLCWLRHLHLSVCLRH